MTELKTNCPKCGRPSLSGSITKGIPDNKEHYCYEHYIEWKESIFLDNSNPDDLGIIRWIKECLSAHVPNAFPDFHILFYALALSLYDPLYTNKFERLREIIAYRESAKSTVFTFFLPAYILAFNNKKIKLRRFNIEEDPSSDWGYTIKWLDEVVEGVIKENYIVIVSETGDMAEDFMLRIRDEFTINKVLTFYHPGKIQDAFDAIDGEWTKRAFKYNDCFIAGIGQGMQARGRIKGTSRITLMILDDIYSEKNTKTDTTRSGIRSWWDKAIKNSVDMKKGKIVFAGTIVHEDTVLVDNMENELWHPIKVPLMPVDKFDYFINSFIKLNFDAGICELPFEDIKNEYERIYKQREHFKVLQGNYNWRLTWPDRVGLYEIALMIKETVTKARRKKTIDNIYQEYFHQVIPESSKRFTKDLFQPSGPFKVFKANGINWIDWPQRYTNPVPIFIQGGLDIGGGLSDGDDTVITVAGALPDYTRIIITQIIGKLKMRDRLKNKQDARYDIVVLDRNEIEKLGYADEIYRLHLLYNFDSFNIGTGNMGEVEIIDQISLFFRNMDVNLNFNERKQTVEEGKKAERIANSIHGIYSTRSVWHGPGLTTLEHQLEFLGKTSLDDAADSAECSLFEITVPMMATYNEGSYKPPEEYDKATAILPWERHIKKKVYDWRVP